MRSTHTQTSSDPGAARRWRREDFGYELPAELVAQHPAAIRDASRLLDLSGAAGVSNKPPGELARTGAIFAAHRDRLTGIAVVAAMSLLMLLLWQISL